MDAADPQSPAPTHAATAWWLAVLAVAAAGVYYRVREVGSLHLILDERHVLRGAAHGSWLDAFTQHTLADRSPAITLFAQLLHHLGALDELTLRLPMVACGILLLHIQKILLFEYGE